MKLKHASVPLFQFLQSFYNSSFARKAFASVKLPYYQLATVSRAKVVDYLLSASHPQGRHKLRFFTDFGFSREKWETLAAAVKQHAADHQVVKVETTYFGTRYVVEGIMEAPDGRFPGVRTVWFVAKGDTIPRLTTAYPARGV